MKQDEFDNLKIRLNKTDIEKLLKRKDYLGDGLYAHFDGYHIILSTPRENGEHYVALEPSVLAAFDQYKERINKLISNLKEVDE